jgi:hypothetical protein
MNFDFMEVFTRAWKITWKYKVLWIFGILASCGRGSSSSNSNNRSNGNSGSSPFSPEMTQQAERFFQQVGRWFEQNTWIIYAFILFIIVLALIQVILRITGTAGLVRGVFHVENGAETLHFGELLEDGLKYFWRLFGVGFIIGLPIFLIIITVIGIAFASAMSSAAPGAGDAGIASMILILFIGLCCCMVPVSIVLGMLNITATRAVTLEDKGVFEALGRGWQVLAGNAVPLVLVGVIIYIFSLVLGIILAIPVIIIVLPLVATLMQGNITSWQPFILAGVALLCYSPIALFFQGVLTTYTESVWTLSYMRLTKPKEVTPVFAEPNA